MSDNEEKTDPTAGPSKPKVEGRQRSPLPPEIDLRSELFDPLKALYADEKYFRFKNVKVYDNIAQFESAMKGNIVGKPKQGAASTSKSQSDHTVTDATRVRRFLPHQGLCGIVVRDHDKTNSNNDCKLFYIL